MPEEQANGQTRILERDIQHLSDSFRQHNQAMETQFKNIADEQRHQWEKIEESSRLLTDVRLRVGTLTAYAVLGSVVGSAIVATLVQIAAERIFN